MRLARALPAASIRVAGGMQWSKGLGHWVRFKNHGLLPRKGAGHSLLQSTPSVLGAFIITVPLEIKKLRLKRLSNLSKITQLEMTRVWTCPKPV